MECVILFRLNSGRVDFVSSGHEISVFKNLDEAVEYVEKHSRLLQTIPYQIVELDEL
jgi:hypothetical protein